MDVMYLNQQFLPFENRTLCHYCLIISFMNQKASQLSNKNQNTLYYKQKFSLKFQNEGSTQKYQEDIHLKQIFNYMRLTSSNELIEFYKSNQELDIKNINRPKQQISHANYQSKNKTANIQKKCERAYQSEEEVDQQQRPVNREGQTYKQCGDYVQRADKKQQKFRFSFQEFKQFFYVFLLIYLKMVLQKQLNTVKQCNQLMPLTIASRVKNKLIKYFDIKKQLSTQNTRESLQRRMFPKLTISKIPNPQCVNKWVFLILGPTHFIQAFLKEGLQFNFQICIEHSAHGNIQIGILEEKTKSENFNYLPNNRASIHIRNRQVFDNKNAQKNNKRNTWRDGESTKRQNLESITNKIVQVKIFKKANQNDYKIKFSMLKEENQDWSQTATVTEQIISNGFNFFTGFYHSNDKISINAQKASLNAEKNTQLFKRNRSHSVTKTINQAQRQTSKKIHRDKDSQNQQQGEPILQNTIQITKKEETQQGQIEITQIINQLQNYKEAWQKSGRFYQQESLIKKYSKNQKKEIEEFIRYFMIMKERKYQTNLPLFKNEQNNKMQEYFIFTIKELKKQTKNELHDDMFFPEFSIYKKDNCRNKWVFYTFGLTVYLKSLDLTSKPLKAKILIDKSSHSNIQVGIVSKSCISQHFNTLSNHRNGLHVRNHQIFDGLQSKGSPSQSVIPNHWRQAVNKTDNFDKIQTGTAVDMELFFNNDKQCYEIKWTIQGWSESSEINEKTVVEGINFYIGLFHTGDQITINKKDKT